LVPLNDALENDGCDLIAQRREIGIQGVAACRIKRCVGRASALALSSFKRSEIDCPAESATSTAETPRRRLSETA